MIHPPLPLPASHMPRRTFLARCGTLSAAWAGLPPLAAATTSPDGWDPSRPFPRLGRPLTIQPVLMYALAHKRDQASWRSWGDVQDQLAVDDEARRIDLELAQLAAKADFTLQIRPTVPVSSIAQTVPLATRDHDVTIVYPATGSGDLLRSCLTLKPDSLVFVRHKSGPLYYWYEALSTRYLQKSAPTADSAAPNLPAHVDDVVVDDPRELLWRLRALFGVNNLRGSRILALGGAWGKYAPDAPQTAQKRFGLEIVDVPYADFEPSLRRARADRETLDAAERWTRRYLALPRTKLLTDRKFVVNAFVLYRVLRDLMREHNTQAFTIKSCMGTIIPMSETTACLPLELLNDEGFIAFCESDFVAIPAGLLLRHIAGRPVFLHNSTFPHQQIVTCAHCTCPRRLDGRRYEPAEIMTHYESDYGAAPKVRIPPGQPVTFVDPEYSTTRWLGFKGIVRTNPFLPICRSQQDVEIQGDWTRLRNEVRDSHWIMAYGDWLRELGYAARKLGLDWGTLDPQPVRS